MSIFTIIGSRQTPEHILTVMEELAYAASKHGIIVRSGKAGGADAAALKGCMRANTNTPHEMYIPWHNFGESWMDKRWDILLGDNKQAEHIAQTIHPAWERCSQGARKLHTRNIGQILGKDLETPSDVVFYYCKERGGKPTGGTATAVNLANSYGCTTINMLHNNWFDKFKALRAS